MNMRRREICRRTMSSNAFYYIVKDALERRETLSAVRMADGERTLFLQALEGDPFGTVQAPKGHGVEWLTRYGVEGMPNDRLVACLAQAAHECTHFCPSINGLEMESYNLYDIFPRDFYTDNFFPDQFTTEQKTALYKTAGHVLLIHGNPNLADSMQLRVQANLDVKVSYLRLRNWREADGVVKAAQGCTAPLVLFAAGPASKWIGPEIARRGNKVTLDLGHGADLWTMSHLTLDRAKAEAFHAKWVNGIQQPVTPS